MTVIPHPIEVESYRIIDGLVDLSSWDPLDRAVVTRVIHASADLEYAETMRIDPGGYDKIRRNWNVRDALDR